MNRKDHDLGKKEQAADRRAHAFELRKRGASYRTIGRELRVSEKTAHQDVQKVLASLAETDRQSAEEYRVLELARLDLALLSLAPKLSTGNPGVVNAWVRVSESRRKLLGLDAPTQIQVGGALTASLYLELRTTVLALLPPDQRVRLAEALEQLQVIDAPTIDRSEDGA